MNDSIKIQTLQGTDTQAAYTSKANYNFHLLADYIAGVKGIQGERGKQGIPGIQGPKGETGERGEGIYFYDEEEWKDKGGFDAFVKANNLNPKSLVLTNSGIVYEVGEMDDEGHYNLSDDNLCVNIPSKVENASSDLEDEQRFSIYKFNNSTGIVPYIYTNNYNYTSGTNSFLLGKKFFVNKDNYEISNFSDGDKSYMLTNHILTIVGSGSNTGSNYNNSWWNSDSTKQGICIGVTNNFDQGTISDYDSTFIITSNYFKDENKQDLFLSESILNLVGRGKTVNTHNSSLRIITYGDNNINNIAFCSGTFLKKYKFDAYGDRIINNSITFYSNDSESNGALIDKSIIATAETQSGDNEFLIRTDSSIFEILTASSSDFNISNYLLGGYGSDNISKLGLNIQSDTYNKSITLLPFANDDQYSTNKKELAKRNYCNLNILNAINGSITIGGGYIDKSLYYYDETIDGISSTVSSIYENMGSVIIRGGWKEKDSFYSGKETGMEFYKCGNILISSGFVATRSGSSNGCIVIDACTKDNSINTIFNDKDWSTIYINSYKTNIDSKLSINIKSGDDINLTSKNINLNGNVNGNFKINTDKDFKIESNGETEILSFNDISIISGNGLIDMHDLKYNYTDISYISSFSLTNTVAGNVDIVIKCIGRVASVAVYVNKSWGNDVGTVGCIRVGESTSLNIGINPIGTINYSNEAPHPGKFVYVPMYGALGEQDKWEVCGMFILRINNGIITNFEFSFTKYGNGNTYPYWSGFTTFLFEAA